MPRYINSDKRLAVQMGRLRLFFRDYGFELSNWTDEEIEIAIRTAGKVIRRRGFSSQDVLATLNSISRTANPEKGSP